MAKAKSTDDEDKLPPPTASIPVLPGKDAAGTYRNLAAAVTSPDLAAWRVVRAAEAKSGLAESLDTPALLAELQDQAKRTREGETGQQESMLINQATALQSLFARLAERAMGNDQVAPFEANMRMALRAQSQCRATLETLALMRNPPVIYAKQANIANGPQQVNNGPDPAREIETQQDKLSSAHELLPDTRASSAVIRTHPTPQDLGEVDRAANARGKGEGCSQRVQRRGKARTSRPGNTPARA